MHSFFHTHFSPFFSRSTIRLTGEVFQHAFPAFISAMVRTFPPGCRVSAARLVTMITTPRRWRFPPPLRREPPRFRLHTRTLDFLVGDSTITTPFFPFPAAGEEFTRRGLHSEDAALGKAGLHFTISSITRSGFCHVLFFLSFYSAVIDGTFSFVSFFFLFFPLFFISIAWRRWSRFLTAIFPDVVAIQLMSCPLVSGDDRLPGNMIQLQLFYF